MSTSINPDFVDSITADLLERIRNLKESLRSNEEAISSGVGQSSECHDPRSGQSTPSGTSIPQNRQHGHFSPPTRDSTLPRSNSQSEGAATLPDRDLIEETWHLLTQVTYVRVVVDRITWEEAPRFLTEELKRQRNARQKSLITLEYWFPSLTSSDDGSVSSRDLSRKVVLPAKHVLSKVAHFNHRNVVLLRMTQPLLQLWAHSFLTIKIFARKKLNVCIGKCNIPLCKLLVLPFSFDADMPLEAVGDHPKCTGKLKVCVQLGSRLQSFTERVEPMRNPAATVSELSFVDPIKLVEYVPASTVRPTAVAPLQLPVTTAGHSGSRETSADRPISSGKQPTSSTAFPPSTVSPVHFRPPQQPHRLNETFCEESSKSPVTSQASHPGPPSWRPGIVESQDSNAAWLRYLTSRRPVTGGSDGRGALATEPYVSNISVYGNGGLRKTASVQTVDVAPTTKTTSQTEAAVQTSTIKEQNRNVERSAVRSGRRPTVAEKILMNRSSCSLENSQDSLPPASAHQRGFWLQLTIHRARNLPLMKQGTELSKPRCFWTYGIETGTCYSPIATESCEPVWEWSHRIFVSPQRKTLVLKLWHRGKEGKDRVIGFVAVMFPIHRPFQRVWYDIIDLTRSSTGQVEVSFDETTGGDDTGAPPDSASMVQLKRVDGGTKENSVADERVFTEQAVNTTLLMAISSPEDDQRRSTCSSPFIALTSRSFLSHKLRTNMEELSMMTSRMKGDRAPAISQSPAMKSKQTSESEETRTVEETLSQASSVGTTGGI